MARDFDSASSQYIEHSTAAVTAVPATMACWFRTASVDAVAKTLMSIGDSAADTKLYLYVRLSSDGIRATTVAVGGSVSDATISLTLTTGQWYHGCGVFASATDRSAFIDGGNKVTNVTSRTLGTPTVTTIGARYAAGVRGLYFDGSIAEPAIWDVALTDAEVLMLALGYSPVLVRPESLRRYYPLLGRYSPEIDVRGGFDGTVTGATVGDHPRVIYKRRRAYVFKPTALLQFARPDSDITPGDWTPSSGGDLFAMVDEVSANDSDRIRSNTGAGDDAVTLGLSDITTPEAGDVSITIRHRIGT